jgi:hypothetical protein
VPTIEQDFAVLAFSTVSTSWAFQPAEGIGKVEELKKSKD